MRSLALCFALLLFLPAAAFACHPAVPGPPKNPMLRGAVTDPTGASIPNAEIDLVDASGAPAGKFQSGADGSFAVTAPHAGAYTLVVSEAGFTTARVAVKIAT